eukprot:1195739-Prorocentrum_minimum.AAC.8
MAHLEVGAVVGEGDESLVGQALAAAHVDALEMRAAPRHLPQRMVRQVPTPVHVQIPQLRATLHHHLRGRHSAVTLSGAPQPSTPEEGAA